MQREADLRLASARLEQEVEHRVDLSRMHRSVIRSRAGARSRWRWLVRLLILALGIAALVWWLVA